MPKRSTRKAPASLVLRSAGKKLKSDRKEEVEPPQPKNTMEDLPPEVKTIILDHITRNESRQTILGYRLVNSQWKDIIGSLLEKKIITGHSEAFPVMRIHPRNQRKIEDLLFVRHSATMLPKDRNPFPSNSLLLYGKGGGPSPHYFPESVGDTQRMELPDFMSKSGGYLTSLTLQVVVVPGMNSLVTLLSSMSSLRALSLVTVYFDDKVIKPNLVFPTPPTLPNLTTLNVECESYRTRSSYDTKDEEKPGRFEEKKHILYIWLIASYADQLLQLSINTGEPLPALRRGTQYYCCYRKSTTLSIATTSDSAFRNLKELKIDHPSKLTMRDCQLPKLERITLSNSPHYFHGKIKDITDFIGKCRNTLEKLHLDVGWGALLVQECDDDHEIGDLLPPPPPIGSPHPKLKTLEIIYSPWPRDDRSEDTMMSRFLVLFPALETLHFLRFPSDYITTGEELATVNLDLGAGNLANEIVAAKTRLVALEEGLNERINSFRQQFAAIPRRADDRYKLKDELYDFEEATYVERERIYEELAALGVRKQDAVMEQLLEGHGIWNTCPSLKLVYVSSGVKPDGDVCIIRRPEEV